MLKLGVSWKRRPGEVGFWVLFLDMASGSAVNGFENVDLATLGQTHEGTLCESLAAKMPPEAL
jgi:hypothetical protein